jgi:hypothetical protein
VPNPRSPLEAAFWKFHADNPAVYAELVRLAREWRAKRGTERVAIATLYEVMRWMWATSTVGDHFKLNNDWRAFYSRVIMEREPDLAGVFETRRQTHALGRVIDFARRAQLRLFASDQGDGR